MYNILITGSDGQVGSEIKNLNKDFLVNHFKYFYTDKNRLDITKREDVENFINKNNINIIINCAAYTAVDKAEEDKELASLINYKAVESLANLAKKKNIILIHISTDYVFDGKNYKPYNENDTTNPQSIYGFTKLKGEKAFLASKAKGAIIRTSWVYSSFGNNFVKTILKLAKNRDKIGVVFDQIGTPTYARDLAKVILGIVDNLIVEDKATAMIYHYSNEGVCSWYDFAKEITNIKKYGCQINPIHTSEYPTIANRPYFSFLDKRKIKEKFNIKIPHWIDSLKECLKEID